MLGAGGGDFVAVAAVEMLDDGNGLVVAGLVVEGDLEGFLGGLERFGFDEGGAQALAGEAGGGAEIEGGVLSGGEGGKPVGTDPFEGAVGLDRKSVV